ncbi:phosphotransferase [Rhodohalobacter sp. 8-1]|uniref:phosphotransferase n=1 Tax=Rhodohalobacter sp. 8-1 TaxID=3131972 RepID=UPI0030EBD136
MSDFTRDQLIKILHENVPEFSFSGEIDCLSGGNINVVWRAKGETNVIIKHAPPHIAVNPDVPLSDFRIDFEARALMALNKGGQFSEITGEEIRPPELIAYDKERSLIIMEDVGDFQQLNKLDIVNHSPEQIGKRLGQFIGNLHRTTFHDEKFGSEFRNLDIQNVRNQLQYQSAHEYADVPDSTLQNKLQKKSSNLGHRLLKPGKCLIMGDLWPPSVLVNKSDDIRLIDWEFVHFGRPLQDIGHFAAHCRMQQHIAKSEAVYDFWTETWREFWSAYRESTGSFYDDLFDTEELNDMGVHIGTEILVRAFGPFKDGYVYEPFDKTHSVLDEAKEMSIDFILNPKPVRFGV